MPDTSYDVPLRVRSHVLRLLGDQLVGHDRLAVFELVKNSYDADARDVSVTLNLSQRILSVKDDGHGMTVDTVKNKWLDIGTDSKRGLTRTRSPLFGRMPLGEKGVGRLAVQKLGSSVSLVTRASNSNEVYVQIEWPSLIDSSAYVDGHLKVKVIERSVPRTFMGKATGTIIEVSSLSRTEWTRKDLRDLKRLIVSLESPFSAVDSFNVTLDVPGRMKDIADVPDLSELLQRSLWKYSFSFDHRGLMWEYDFSPPRLKGLTSRKLASDGFEMLETTDEERKEIKASALAGSEVPLFVNPETALKGIGAISGHIYVFYGRDEIIRLMGDPRQTKQWLKEQSGVRVFRDGIRVYNYGEPADDWLGLNTRRINRPTSRFGSGQLVGAINLDLESSPGLKEKTNREGFNQDETFERFQRVILAAIESLEKLHDSDRRAIDQALRSDSVQIGSTIGLREAIDGLKAACKTDPQLSQRIAPYVGTIEREVQQVRDVMINAGMAGIGLALVYHEIEKSLRLLTTLAERGTAPDRLRSGLADLSKMIESISVLMRQGKARKLSARGLLKQIIDLNSSRFKFHGVVVSAPVLTGEQPDFFVTAPEHLILGAVNNIIDNAIYWSEFEYKKNNSTGGPPALYIGTHWGSDGGAIVFCDNGGGLKVSAADAVQPFVSNRTGGMGLGLYYCRLVMENLGGKLVVGDRSDVQDYVDIPGAYTGAAVALVFKREGEEQ